MASSKKVLVPESNGGFKTVAFGFDKNDVNMYIANLRKKMKTMEEEFEQKLTSALENPAASNDALKHEREIIRAEAEKMWGEKLSERNQILKQQQDRINELEDELRISKEKIASLRTQLSAATSENNSDGVIRARAAKAYMQFTRELRFISGSVEKTLEEMEQRWKGDFFKAGENITEDIIEQSLTEKNAYVMDEPAKTDINEKSSSPNDNFDSTLKADKSLSETASKLLAEPLPEIMKTEDKNNGGYPVSEETASEPFSATSDPLFSEADSTANADNVIKYAAAPAPKQAAAGFEGFDELLAHESDPIYSIEPPQTVSKEEKPSPKHKKYSTQIDVDDDLSSLLADEPVDNKLSDDEFEKLLKPSDPKNNKSDIFITENEINAIKGDDLDALTLSDIVINPGEMTEDLGEMLKEREDDELDAFKGIFVTASDDSERSDGLGISSENIKADMDSAEPTDKENTDSNNSKKNDDLFDFSFLSAESDDEDDMSTDVSFHGML